MRSIVVLSTNSDPKYSFFIPIVTWAWNRLGWDTLTLIPGTTHEARRAVITPVEWVRDARNRFAFFDVHTEYREDTQTQCSRLYACSVDGLQDEDYLLTSDMDMLPLCEYWRKTGEGVTLYGHDLTDYAHVPICYAGATVSEWRRLMATTWGSTEYGMIADLNRYPKAKSNATEDYWCTDQDILTDKIKAYAPTNAVQNVFRGMTEDGLAYGRVDRYKWNETRTAQDKIDCHLLRPGFGSDNFAEIMSLIKECFDPTDDEIKFLTDYRNAYLGWTNKNK